MKKFISLLLVLVLVLSLSTVAFATDGGDSEVEAPAGGTTTTVTYTPTLATEFKEIVKTYTSENNVVVNETLKFTSEAKTTNPDQGTANLTVDDLVVSTLNPGTLTVHIPSLSVAGKYEWTIKETAGNTAGVTYSTAEVHVIVLVEYNNDDHKLQIANKTSYIVKPENGEKMYTFTNTFESGSFTVAKDVTGNMANENDQFEIAVTLTSANPIGTTVTLAGTEVAPSSWTKTVGKDEWTYTATLPYSEASGAKTFSNIPTGVVVTVAENTSADKMNGYTYKSTKIGNVDFTSLTIADDTNAAIVVTNENSTSVETGITMDSVPYILLLAVACVGLVLFFVKKRSAREY